MTTGAPADGIPRADGIPQVAGPPPPASPPPPLDDRTALKVAFGALVGNSLEWYDFFLFTTAAALVFNSQYFASDDPVTSALASFATLAVGFVARPAGGLLFGRLGDRIGRRRTLLITVTLIGVSTGCIGLLPNAMSIGVAAPVLLTLLRVVQGLALGGEWSGAIIIAVEHAPPERRGRYAALPLIGSPVGTLLSSGAFVLVSLLSKDTFDAWGWRLPFLAAIPLLLVALYIRSRLEESPAFTALVAENDIAHAPISTVLRDSWRHVLVGMCVALLGMAGFFLVTTFVMSYGTRVLGVDRNILLGSTLVAAVAEVFVIIGAGRLSERYGPARVVTVGGVATAVVAFPVFWLISSAQPLLIALGMTLGVAALSFPYGGCASVLTGLFVPKLRYTGVSIASNAAAVISGCVPLVATAVFSASGDQIWTAAALLVVISLTTAAGGVFAPALAVEEPHQKGTSHV